MSENHNSAGNMEPAQKLASDHAPKTEAEQAKITQEKPAQSTVKIDLSLPINPSLKVLDQKQQPNHHAEQNKDQLSSKKNTQISIQLEEIKRLVSQMNIKITEVEMNEYLAIERQKGQGVSQKHLQEWLSKKQIEKQSQKHIQESKKIQEVKQQGHTQEKQSKKQTTQSVPQKVMDSKEVEAKKSIKELPLTKEAKVQQKEVKYQSKANSITKENQVKAQVNDQQIINAYLASYKKGNELTIKAHELNAFSNICNHKVSQKIINQYLLNSQTYSLSAFKDWETNNHSKQVAKCAQKIKDSHQSNKEIYQKLEKIFSLLHNESKKEILNINIQLGDGKSKSMLKYGLSVNKSVENTNKNVNAFIQIKTKKPQELRELLESDLQKLHSQDILLELSSVKVIAAQKSVQISISSEVLNILLKGFKDKIEKATEAFKLGEILKFEGELLVKQSTRDEEKQLNISKKFIKWLSEGFTKNILIEGNRQTIKYLTGSMAQFFPILKAVKHGDFNIRLKSPENVDKFFQKLGISQLCEQTPTVSTVFEDWLSEWMQITANQFIFMRTIASSILKYSSENNDKISFNFVIGISHLKLHLSATIEGVKILVQSFHNLEKKQQQDHQK